LYYLQKRYYSPSFLLFINADAVISKNGELLSQNAYIYCSNNSVNRVDYDGNQNKTLSECQSFGGGSGIELLPLLYIVLEKLSPAALSMTAAIALNATLPRNHTVYRLQDGDKTLYVGRTTSIEKREKAHNAPGSKTAGLEMVIIKPGLTSLEARGLEQIEMLEYNTKNYLNSINGISPRNENRDIYMHFGRQVAQYLGNTISNEILCWTGQ
jgi:hypothetical protein